MINIEKLEFGLILSDLYIRGKESSPRNLKIKEICNYNYQLSPYSRFCSFNERKLNVNYIKQEFKWYLKGDLHDTSICEHASMWKGLVNGNGTINSNYGHYIFASGAFYRIAEELIKDKYSRRAVVIILNNVHLAMGENKLTNDIPCTYSLNFQIRENKLNMKVNMRSQDAFFGMGNDAPCFSFIHEMMFIYLKDFYKDLEYGVYMHSADSFHIYERHFEALEKIIKSEEFEEIKCPKISSSKEVNFLIKHDFSEIPNEFEFAKWLNYYEK